MTIQCDTLENFLDTIEGLVKRGLDSDDRNVTNWRDL